MSTTETSKKITELSNSELLEQLNEINEQIEIDYKILSARKAVKKEVIDEIIKRFGGSKNDL